MRTMKQLLRQPAKAVIGILLIAVAVAVLMVCVCQSIAAEETNRSLEYDFTTIALERGVYYVQMTDGQAITYAGTPEEVEEWVEQIAADHPEVAVGYVQTGLASAYLPELTADHYSTYYSPLEGLQSLEGYISVLDCAMLVVTLEQIGEPEVETHPVRSVSETGEVTTMEIDGEVQVLLQARVEQVLCLAEQQADPTGCMIELKLTVESAEKLRELELEVGGQYIVNGRNFFDNSTSIAHWIIDYAETFGWSIGEYNSSKLYFLTEEDRKVWLTHDNNPPTAIYGDRNVIKNGIPKVLNEKTGEMETDNSKVIPLYDDERFEYYKALLQYGTFSMSIKDHAAMPVFKNDGSLSQERAVWVDGVKQVVSWDEYKALYSTPTIAKLEGSVEAFLQENKFWSEWLDCQNVNTHAFPVFAVDKLDYIADFNRGLARITQGRDFTQTEIANGSNVCIISETLAELNGLSVGDTISPQFYECDYSLRYQIMASRNDTIHFTQAMSNPGYFHAGSTLENAKEYTIVGIYRKDMVWENYSDNHYSFTPNTIFVPKSSVTVAMDWPEDGLFKVLVLQNGMCEAFDEMVSSKEYTTFEISQVLSSTDSEMFVYLDQGYKDISGSIVDFLALARQVLIVGIVMYIIVLILFLLLYPCRQGKALRTMALYGTPRKNKIAHVLLSALGILLPGTVLGAGLGIVLWGVVVSRLLTASGAMFSLTLDLGTLALIAAAQLLLALALTLLLAIPMTTHKSVMQRK